MPNDEGTPGAPDQAAGGVGASDAELLDTLGTSGEPAKPEADTEFWDKVRATPREQWPEDVRRKGEEDVLRFHTRKMNEIQERQTRMLDAITARLQQQGTPVGPDERAALAERIKAGEFEMIPDLVTASMKKEVAPMMDQLLKDRAIAQAEKMHPYVGQKQAEIAEVLRSNPDLQELASANGYRNAPQVLYAIARDIQARELEAEVKSLREQRAAAEKGRSASIPGQLSKAGTSRAAGAPARAEVNSLRDAMKVAAQQLGQPVPREYE